MLFFLLMAKSDAPATKQKGARLTSQQYISKITTNSDNNVAKVMNVVKRLHAS